MSTGFRQALGQLNDSRSGAHAVTSATLLGALSLIEPRRLSVPGRLAYRGALAGTVAWTTWAALNSEENLLNLERAAFAAAAGGAAMGLSEAGEALDARLQDFLERAGIARPRVWVALGTVALTLGAWCLDRRVDSALAESPEGPDGEPVELPEQVRAIIDRLLAATDAFGAPELRAQLAQARALPELGPREPGFVPVLTLDVPDGLPLAVPANALFPVSGRFTALGGRTFDVSCSVAAGRLERVFVAEAEDWPAEDYDAWTEAGRSAAELPGWPDAAGLTLLSETPDGLRPVE